MLIFIGSDLFILALLVVLLWPINFWGKMEEILIDYWINNFLLMVGVIGLFGFV